MLLRIKTVKLRLFKDKKPISIQIEGFDMVFIVINQFEEWQDKKLQLLHMLEEIKALLVRNGIFDPDKYHENSFERADENQMHQEQEDFKENSPNDQRLNRNQTTGVNTRHSSTRSFDREGIK